MAKILIPLCEDAVEEEEIEDTETLEQIAEEFEKLSVLFYKLAGVNVDR